MSLNDKKYGFNFSVKPIHKKASNKLKKLAGIDGLDIIRTYGEYAHVVDTKTMQLANPLVSSLLKLPKYQEIINQIKTAKGVVNIVTGPDPWIPLIELMIKEAIPPAQNATYNFDYDVASPSDYFIDAGQFFGSTVAPDPQHIQRVTNKLNGVINGTPLAIDQSTLKALYKDNAPSVRELSDMVGNDWADAKIRGWLSSLFSVNEPTNEEVLQLFVAFGLRPPGIQGIQDQSVPQAQREKDEKRQQELLNQFQVIIAELNTARELATVGELSGNKMVKKTDKLSAVKTKFGDLKAQLIISKLNEYSSKKASILSSDLKRKLEDQVEILNNHFTALFYKNNGEPFEQSHILGKDDIHKISIRISIGKEKLLSEKDKLALAYQDVFSMLPMTESKAGDTARVGGFAAWNPVKTHQELKQGVIDAKNSYKSSATDEATINNICGMFEQAKDAILTYPGYSPEIIKLKQDFHRFLSAMDNVMPEDGVRIDPSAYGAIVQHYDELMVYIDKLGKQLKNQGGAIVFYNTDNCALCITDPHTKSTSLLDNSGVLNSFNAKVGMDDDSRSFQGSKKIVFISEKPISNMGSFTSSAIRSTSVYMDLVPVEYEEAKIIVDHVFGDLGKRFEQSFVSAKNRLVAREKNGPDAELAKNDPAKFEGKIKENFIREWAKFKKIDPSTIKGWPPRFFFPADIKENVITNIIGFPQHQAIKTVLSVMSKNMTESEEMDTYGLFYANPNKVLQEVQGEYEKFVQGDQNVIKRRKIEVKWDGYVASSGSKPDPTKKTTVEEDVANGWHGHVEDLRRSFDSIDSYDIQINNRMAHKIKLSEMIKNPSLNAKQKQEYMQQIQDDDATIIEARKKKASIYRGVPQVYLIYGPPGSGKTIWADALADRLSLSLYTLDFTDLKSKWHGETEQMANRVFNMIKASRNTVFLIDEVDRQFEGGTDSSGGQDSQHGVTKAVIGKFLELLENNRQLFEDNNVHIVMATNNIDKIEDAIKSRARGNVYEVAYSQDPEEYKQFFKSVIDTEERKSPDECSWAYAKTAKEAWDKVRKRFFEDLDINSIAKYFAENKMGFRSLTGLLGILFDLDKDYENSLKLYGDGCTNTIGGMPLTTESFLYLVIRTKELESVKRGRKQEKSGQNQFGAVVHGFQASYQKKIETVFDDFYKKNPDKKIMFVNGRPTIDIAKFIEQPREIPEEVKQVQLDVFQLPKEGEENEERYPVRDGVIDTTQKETKQKEIPDKDKDAKGNEEEPPKIVDDKNPQVPVETKPKTNIPPNKPIGQDPAKKLKQVKDYLGQDMEESTSQGKSGVKASASNYLVAYLHEKGFVKKDGKKYVYVGRSSQAQLPQDSLAVESVDESIDQEKENSPFWKKGVEYSKLGVYKGYGNMLMVMPNVLTERNINLFQGGNNPNVMPTNSKSSVNI